MNKRIFPVLLAAVLIPCVSDASDVTLSHTFTAGTPARADEVNQNFADIKRAVDDNNSRITGTETTLSGNTAAITTNSATITSNTTAINSNSTAITANTADITTHASAIAGHSSAIATNTSTITANTTDIATNTTAISGNSARIASTEADTTANAAAIDANTQNITANTASISTIHQAVNIYDATGNRLGRYLGTAPLIDTSYSKWVHQGAVVWMLSDNGYLFALQRWYGLSVATLLGIEYFTVPTTATNYSIAKAKLYYTTSNCTGSVYLSKDQLDTIAYSGFSPILSVRGGFVFNVTDMSSSPTAYYLPQDNSAIPIAYQSSRDWNSTACTTTSATLLESALEIFPNDASITGIDTAVTYSWPLKFGY